MALSEVHIPYIDGNWICEQPHNLGLYRLVEVRTPPTCRLCMNYFDSWLEARRKDQQKRLTDVLDRSQVNLDYLEARSRLDDLSPFRGIVYGVLFSSIFWITLFAIILGWGQLR